MLQIGVYNDQSMTLCSVFAGESLPIDATMSGCPGIEETALLVIFLLPLSLLFSLSHVPNGIWLPCQLSKTDQGGFYLSLVFPPRKHSLLI